MNAMYVDFMVPECGTNRATSLPTLCLCRKNTSVYNGAFLEHSRAVSTRLMCVEPGVHSVLFTAAVRRPSTAVITLSDKIKFHNW
jgi:hypothetical protein